MKVFAPAKVNLALHVTGQREDGYHLLDSLVVFAGVGDDLEFQSSDRPELRVSGPFASGVPTGSENLIWKAHALFGTAPPVQILLEKNLPHAAGIGGGSSDAAATLRALARQFGQQMPTMRDVLSLGADVPVCLSEAPQRMEGIGEILSEAPDLPPLDILLVNPRVSVPTGPVFEGLDSKNNAPLSGMTWHVGQDRLTDFVAWLSAQRNDLEAPACRLSPEILRTLDAISEIEGCLLARMSGSGATCFGLFDGRRPEAAQNAARAIAAAHPDWWVKNAPVLGRATSGSR